MSDDIKIKIDKLPAKVEMKIRSQLRIGADLDAELDEAAGWYGYYMACAVRAETKLTELNLAFDIWRAGEERKINAATRANGDKALTKDNMHNAVIVLPKYQEKMSVINKAKEAKSMMKGLEKAFEKKVETIRTKCSNKRKESLA